MSLQLRVSIACISPSLCCKVRATYHAYGVVSFILIDCTLIDCALIDCRVMNCRLNAASICLQVTIVPREKFPLGQTIVQVNEQREATKQFTRRYLEEQIITALAGTPLARTTAARAPAGPPSQILLQAAVMSSQQRRRLPYECSCAAAYGINCPRACTRRLSTHPGCLRNILIA